MEASNIPLQKWVAGMYLMVTNLKGVSSMKLHRDLEISQPAAWFMAQRLREGWNAEDPEIFEGPVEVDEVYIGVKPRKPGESKRGRGTKQDTSRRDQGSFDTNRISAEVISDLSGRTLTKFVEDRTRLRAPSSTRTETPATSVCVVRTIGSTTGTSSMFGARSTRTALRAFGRCSNADTWEPITG